MSKNRNGSLEKSARLIILLRLDTLGRLEGRSLQKIADLFQIPPSRSTIMRDLRDLENLKIVIKDMLKKSKRQTKGETS